MPRLALTDTNYRAWAAIYDTPCAEHLAAIRLAIDRLTWRPTVGVVVFRGDHAAEAMTLESFEAQFYPEWCLTKAPSGDVTLFLPAGTLLALTALYHIAAAAATVPSVELVCADEDQLDPDGRRIKPWFKPAWDPVLTTECDLLGFTGVCRRRLLHHLARLRRLGLFWGLRPLLINGLAEKVFTTRGYWGRWGRLVLRCAGVAVAAD